MANYNLNELARVLATKAMEDEDIDIDSMLTRIAGPSAAWIPSSFSAEDHRITATDASINRGATPSRVLSRPGEASSTSLSDPGFRSPINDLPDVLSSIPMPHNREPLTPVAVPANIQATPDDRTPKTPTSPRPMTSTSSQTHSVFIPTYQSPKNKPRKPSEKMKNIFKSKGFKIGTFIAAGTLGAVGAIAAAPLVVAGLGFTSAGIAAGSAAASIMSTLGGGATAAGSTVAILQSIGATGTVLGSAVATGAAATAGGIVGVAAGAGVNAGISAAIQNTNSGGKPCRSIGTQTDDDEEKVEENEAP